jgi:predicted O-linked N-acetylglucosamine transferase (SPINDLY family)
MLPQMDQLEYWNLNLICDVFLDTMTWSGCNTVLEAIACDLPVVTVPGEFMRGRHSYAILTQLGVTETIAHDSASYVDLAVRLGVDVEWRNSIVARMRERFPDLYGDRRPVRALEAFYDRAVEDRLRGERQIPD